MLQIWQKQTNHKPWNKHAHKNLGQGRKPPKNPQPIWDCIKTPHSLTVGYSASAPHTENIIFFPPVRMEKVFVPTNKRGWQPGALLLAPTTLPKYTACLHAEVKLYYSNISACCICSQHPQPCSCLGALTYWCISALDRTVLGMRAKKVNDSQLLLFGLNTVKIKHLSLHDGWISLSLCPHPVLINRLSPWQQTGSLLQQRTVTGVSATLPRLQHLLQSVLYSFLLKSFDWTCLWESCPLSVLGWLLHSATIP